VLLSKSSRNLNFARECFEFIEIPLGVSPHVDLDSLYNRRSQWPRGLRHELSSPAPTLGSWVRIPLRHGCLCVFCVRIISELKLLMKSLIWIAWNWQNGLSSPTPKLYMKEKKIAYTTKESVQVRGSCNRFNFLWRGVVSHTPKPQAGGPPLVICPLLLIQCIRR
jgi:hypothetical protein